MEKYFLLGIKGACTLYVQIKDFYKKKSFPSKLESSDTINNSQQYQLYMIGIFHVDVKLSAPVEI